ncbi:MAG TPA: TerD family protein [Blastocatellia bacterium]|nr:TerD family protein [Blastocatellia bacterium]
MRRRSKILLPESEPAGRLSANVVATMVNNLAGWGYSFSKELIEACQALSMGQLTALYGELDALFSQAKGGHRKHQPLYPNFPQQVMEMSDAELFINAILHYWTAGQYFPETEVKKRFPLLDNVSLTQVGLGNSAEFDKLFGQIAASNTSLSDQDKADIRWFVSTNANDPDWLKDHLPPAVPYKENMAYLAAVLLETLGHDAAIPVSSFVKTGTDVLRIGVAMSGGDISLANKTTFRQFKRRERRFLLLLLDMSSGIVEALLKHDGAWIRLGERLHPGDYKTSYPKAMKAFDILRNNKQYQGFHSKVEAAIATGNITEAVALLSSRPGAFARRLDQLFRAAAKSSNSSTPDEIIAAFGKVVGRVSTPVLLQVRQHFNARTRPGSLRTFFPKGNMAKTQVVPNTLPPLPDSVSLASATICDRTLISRFRDMAPLGTCYLDPALGDYLVPFSQRSASKSLRTLVRGSKVPLPSNCETLRFFIRWKNKIGAEGISERTDLDLSAVMFNDDFTRSTPIAYYSLKDSEIDACHSGDIVDAPSGASEFIDVRINRTLATGYRYVVMCVNSFTRQQFSSLPECFAGWMAREHPNSGEIFEPCTVQDRIDVTAAARMVLPMIMDLERRQVIWCDLGIKANHYWYNTGEGRRAANNVRSNSNSIVLALRAMVSLNKPSLLDLFDLHVQARGQRVTNPQEADHVFGVEAGTPFRLEEIASDYMK